ncbi:MAG: hypothetical protein KA886_04840 [Candidatus Cloacimonetes bacterium]|nr:hypothetical protein [Candidatus Cloacimonadota bacterium]
MRSLKNIINKARKGSMKRSIVILLILFASQSIFSSSLNQIQNQSIQYGSFIHELKNDHSKKAFYWVCFPYLNKITSNTKTKSLAYVFQYENNNNLLSTSPKNKLHTLHWKYDQEKFAFYQSSYWTNVENEVDSRYGYKIEMSNDATYSLFEVSGYLCGTYGNENEVMSVKGKKNNPFTEIWIGYFKPQCEDPLFALSDIADDLIEIKTQNWAMNRKSVNDPWISASKKPMLKFGEAVSIKYAGFLNKNFKWRTSEAGEGNNYEEKPLNHFEFIEDIDYVPIYLDLGKHYTKLNNQKAEIGLFINGKCYGAESVNGEMIQINAYIRNLELKEYIFEFRYWNSLENREKIILKEKVNICQNQSLFYLFKL